MKTTNFASLALIAGAALALAAPLRAEEPAAEVAPIKAEGYVAGVDGTFAPHAFPKLDGSVQGFNIDLAAAMSEKLGVPIKISAMQFSGLVPAMAAGTLDYMGAPTTVTAERAKTMLFTEGFMDSNFGVATKAGAGLTSLDDLKGKTISANKGSVYETWLNDHAAEMDLTVLVFGTQADAFEAVTSGRADASLAGMTVAAWAGQQNPALDYAFDVPTGLTWSLAFRRDDYATRNLMDKVLECLKSDGTMAALSEKWFKITPKAGETIVTPTKGYGVPEFEGYQDAAHEVGCTFG
ncbi:transporter substrate-binding domain-containing protein [Frigidibacter sp. MR17.24]|uniref:transporter substrate-binding domain-containing protein n=1 Tax=Frigidibacter sp. MR17.24 TaxID=3127345 RepID=UPI0030129F47